MIKQWNALIGWMVLACVFALPCTQLRAEEGVAEQPGQAKAESASQESTVSEPEVQSEETQAVQTEVEAEADKEVGDKRKQILTEAANAVAETRVALQALEEDKADEALAALEKVTGKLALIVAREPMLALAPHNVAVVTHDLYASPNTVRNQVKTAAEFLDDGAVQAARDVLSMLASEIRIQTTHIPLATYPEAIKAVVPLIDEGRLDEAKTALQLALNTLVVTEDVIPLPLLRTKAILLAAEKLAEDDERTITQNDKLATMLDDARTQMELAQILGYGEKKQFKPIYEDIKEIEKKTQGSKSGKGFFDAIKKKLDEF